LRTIAPSGLPTAIAAFPHVPARSCGNPPARTQGHAPLDGCAAIVDTGLRGSGIIVMPVGTVHFYFGYGY